MNFKSFDIVLRFFLFKQFNRVLQTSMVVGSRSHGMDLKKKNIKIGIFCELSYGNADISNQRESILNSVITY